MTFQKAFGAVVRRKRMGLGLLQKDLVDRTPFVQEQLSRLERGDFATIHPQKLLALGHALQTTVDDLLREAERACHTD